LVAPLLARAFASFEHGLHRPFALVAPLKHGRHGALALAVGRPVNGNVACNSLAFRSVLFPPLEATTSHGRRFFTLAFTNDSLGNVEFGLLAFFQNIFHGRARVSSPKLQNIVDTRHKSIVFVRILGKTNVNR
jgi:hypothetical protein